MAQKTTTVWPEGSLRAGTSLEYSARIEIPGSAACRLWFRVPEERAAWVTDSADPFLIGVLFPAMRAGGRLRVEGVVSPSLLANLEEFQAAWSEWWPDTYRRVEVSAAHEREDAPAASGLAALTFSGGLDSCFSAWRHRPGGGRNTGVALGAAVMVHGFDIPLAETDAFASAARNSARLVESLGLPFLSMACNVRDLGGDWEQTHGAGLASCLHLVRRGFSSGLIASSHTYGTLRLPWGSNPVTDRLLSSSALPIVYDGAGWSRRQKARAVAAWPEAVHGLRVCWEGPQKDRNCGVCVRCVGTAICFAVEGAPVPPSLQVVSLEAGIEGLRQRRLKPAALARLSELLAAARASGRDEPWVGALERCLRHQRIALRLGRVRSAIGSRIRSIRARTNGRGEGPSAPLVDAAEGRPAELHEEPAARAPGPDLYRQLDEEIDGRLRASLGFGLMVGATAYAMTPETVEGFRVRYAAIKRFQQRTLELFQASLRGEVDPEIAAMVVDELPVNLGLEYHRALTDRHHRTPVFFRTDELLPGRLAEVQCCGSGWGIVEQLRTLYDANATVFGSPRHFPLTLARQFATALRGYLGREPIVHHLGENASLPHGVRYFVQRLREQGIRHFSYDASATPSACNFVRSHDFITLPHHNFFADRMERCARGEVFFDLPPSCLFDGKIAQAWPFWEKTRDWYDDEVRGLFPHTSIVDADGFTLANGERVGVEEFCRVPRGRRLYYLKYAGSDIAMNWGSKAVFLASTLTRERCRERMDAILADRGRRRYWICQEAVRHEESVEALERGGGTVQSAAYAKYSGFYGPDGLMALLVFHRHSHKVHGSSDTIASLVR